MKTKKSVKKDTKKQLLRGQWKNNKNGTEVTKKAIKNGQKKTCNKNDAKNAIRNRE